MSREKSQSPALLYHSLAQPVTACLLIYALILLVSYPTGYDVFYRPYSSGGATHPLTATELLLLAYVTYSTLRTKSLPLNKIVSVLAILLPIVVLLDHVFGTQYQVFITPFNSIVQEELAFNSDNKQGLNTAIMLIFIAVGVKLSRYGKLALGQMLLFCAIFIPTVSLFGYVFDLEILFGHMALSTTIAGYTLAFCALALTSQSLLLKAMLSSSIHGRISRYLTSSALAFLIVAGFLVKESITIQEARNQLGLYILISCWVIFALAGVASIFHTRFEESRGEREKELHRLANVDVMTGLFNRRWFWQELERECNRSKRSNRQLWLMLIDIDFFKRINDEAGHPFGDRVLKLAAQTLKQAVRSTDIVGRIGGEEFTVLLNDVDGDKEAVAKVAESIRHSFENLVISGWTPEHGALTVSIGISASGEEFDHNIIYERADKALYHAKQTGRNRVCFFEKILEFS